jgi:hypothetical protein
MIAESENKRLWKDHVVIEEKRTDKPNMGVRKRMVLAKAAENDRPMNMDSEVWTSA